MVQAQKLHASINKDEDLKRNYSTSSKMSSLNTTDLHCIFLKLDKNKDGLVSLDELIWLLEQIGVHFTPDELKFLVGNSCLNFEEFLTFYDSISSHGSNEVAKEEDEDDEEETVLVKAFNVFDMNGDGFISCDELQSVLSRLGLWDASSGRDCKSMIKAYDTNMDGVLDFEEFKKMMLLSTIS